MKNKKMKFFPEQHSKHSSFTPHHYLEYFNFKNKDKYWFKKIFFKTFSSLRNGGGFTLIEILIVVSIIIVLSVIVLTNYEFGGYQFALQRSAYKLSQDLRRTEEMAMSAETYQGSVSSGGYGIYLTHSSSSYILFADNVVVDAGYQTNEKIEEIMLEESVEISQICQVPDSLCDCGNSLDIVFIPPDPIIKFNTKIATTCSTEITLQSTKTRETIKVYVRPTGLIEIE